MNAHSDIVQLRSAPLRLYVREGQGDSDHALALADEIIDELGLPLDVEHLGISDDMMTPRLVTPLSSFHDIEEIQAFIRQERMLPVMKRHLERH